MEKFSVRGDGLMTATTAEAGVSAVVAHATHATYAGDVLVAQTVRASDAGFHLFKVRAGVVSGCSCVCARERLRGARAGAGCGGRPVRCA